MANSTDDSFYASVDGSSQEYGHNSTGEEAGSLDASQRACMEQQWREELAKLEDEIGTLKSVLGVKMSEATELKRKLGITPIIELKEDLKHGLQAIKESETVQKTNEKLHQLGDSIASSDAYQKTNTALKSFGAYASRKMGDLKNSNAFKSVEEKVEGAYTSIKRQVSGSQSEDNFEDVLRSTREQQQQQDEEDAQLNSQLA